jgi:hypothetical protein
MRDENLPDKCSITVGADRGYDTRDFVAHCRERNVAPDVAQNVTKQRGSRIDRRTTKLIGCAMVQRARISSQRTCSPRRTTW